MKIYLPELLEVRRPVCMVTEVRALQSQKAFVPIAETREPIFTVRRLMHPWKAPAPMLVIFPEIVTCFRFLQFLKALAAMAVTL